MACQRGLSGGGRRSRRRNDWSCVGLILSGFPGFEDGEPLFNGTDTDGEGVERVGHVAG